MAKKDPAELIKAIDAEEAELFAEFEKKLKDQREKKLAAIIEPLKKERTDAAQLVNELNTRISEIDKELAKLTGRKAPAARGGGSVTRFRPSAELLSETAATFGKTWKSKHGTKNEVAKKDALSLLDPKWKNHLSKLIDAWNGSDTGKSNKIGTNGKAKTLSRYVMH